MRHLTPKAKGGNTTKTTHIIVSAMKDAWRAGYGIWTNTTTVGSAGLPKRCLIQGSIGRIHTVRSRALVSTGWGTKLRCSETAPCIGSTRCCSFNLSKVMHPTKKVLAVTMRGDLVALGARSTDIGSSSVPYVQCQPSLSVQVKRASRDIMPQM